MAHRVSVRIRNGVWTGHCPDCGGTSEYVGRGDDWRLLNLQVAAEHYHEHNCADLGCECETQRQRRSKDRTIETLRVLDAARLAGPPRRGIPGWLRERTMRRLLAEGDG